jgi:HK97 family phage prohead protease
MDRLTFSAEIKATGDAGEFTCYASVFDNLDSYADRVAKGAFADDLRARGNTRPLLWQHNTEEPIGIIELQEDAHGLRGRGKFVLAVQRARECHELLKAGAISGMSIGYQTLKSRSLRDGSRELVSVRLFECSCVTHAANELAIVDSVKTGLALTALEQFNEQLRAESGDLALGRMLNSAKLLAGVGTESPLTTLRRIKHEAAGLLGRLDNISRLRR